MARIKIKDLPKDQKIGKEEMKKIRGGITLSPYPMQNEEVSLNFSKVKFTYTPAKSEDSKDANVEGSWSISGTSS